MSAAIPHDIVAGTQRSLMLGSCTWPELWHAAPRPLLVVPIGSCEQHGPHLPLDTDTRIAVALANGLADAYAGPGSGQPSPDRQSPSPDRQSPSPDRQSQGRSAETAPARPAANPPALVIVPPLAISASGEHGGFPGTLSIGSTVFEQVVTELVRSADWSGGVVLVNGHGGNAVAVNRAVATLRHERRRVLAWWPRDRDGDAHAGITETSLMLAIAPQLVRLDATEAGRTEPIGVLAEQLARDGVRAVSPNGVLGDPRGATVAHGRALLTKLRIDLIAAVDEWWA